MAHYQQRRKIHKMKTKPVYKSKADLGSDLGPSASDCPCTEPVVVPDCSYWQPPVLAYGGLPPNPYYPLPVLVGPPLPPPPNFDCGWPAMRWVPMPVSIPCQNYYY